MVVVSVLSTGTPVVADEVWDPPDPVDPDDFFQGALWDLELGNLAKSELAAASGFSQLHVSPSGEVLIAGLNNGGILFLETETGAVITTAFTKDHGAVRSISSDRQGERAVFVYDDGYVAAVDASQEELLMSRFSEAGAGRYTDRVGAQISMDGQTLVVTSDRLQIYDLERESHGLVFAPGPELEPALGPHLFLHPQLPYFAALDRDGTLGVFNMELEPQHPLVDLGDEASQVAALAVSHDGSAFALLQSDGRLLRYAVRLSASDPELVLTYESRLRCTVPTCGDPFGVALNTNGDRVMAWTNQQLIWAEGDNQNVPEEEAQKTNEANTVSLAVPVDGSWSFGQIAPDQELSRALITQAGEQGAKPVHHEFPSRSGSDTTLPPLSDARQVTLDPNAGRAYVSHGGLLAAFPVAPPPAANTAGGTDGEDGGFWNRWTPATLLVASLAGLALVTLLGFLVAVLVVSRRGDDARLVAQLELEQGALAPPASARPSLPGGGARSAIRPVAPSAPPEMPPPEGLLMLEGFGAPGAPALKGLRLSLTRPGVVRLYGEKARLARFVAALSGQVPATGLASAGGADRVATPLLFARHLCVSLPRPDDPDRTPGSWYAEAGRQRGVPVAVVKRRLDADLGWMGARLDRPLHTLNPIDRWKVALAVAFLDRPRVLLVWTQELPGGDDPESRATVRSVLAAVGRHYRAAVLLLDPGGPLPEEVVRSWSHEELRLTSHGFRDRALLEEGKRVGQGGASPSSPSGRAQRSNGNSGSNGNNGTPGRWSQKAPWSRTTRSK